MESLFHGFEQCLLEGENKWQSFVQNAADH